MVGLPYEGRATLLMVRLSICKLHARHQSLARIKQPRHTNGARPRVLPSDLDMAFTCFYSLQALNSHLAHIDTASHSTDSQMHVIGGSGASIDQVTVDMHLFHWSMPSASARPDGGVNFISWSSRVPSPLNSKPHNPTFDMV